MLKEDLKLKIEKLKTKWLVEPDKYSKEYWFYRADMCLLIRYETKLKKFGDFQKKDLVKTAQEIFS